MAERSETAVGATTGRPRADEGQSERASEATARMSADAVAAELDAEPDTPADASATAATPTAADAVAPAPAPEQAEVSGEADGADAVPTKDAADEDSSDGADTDEQDSTAKATPDAGRKGTGRAKQPGRTASTPATTGAAADDAERPSADGSAEEPADATSVPADRAKAAAPKAAAPDAAKPMAAEPDATAPKAAAPKVAEPEAAAPVAAPVRHSGDRIARRYRLEECTTSNEVFNSWRAVDEKLRRAVGIHLIAAAHPRAKAVLAAARQAALLGDPRFVQVLDAVEDGDVVYVVREWLPDATGLDTQLLAEPLEAYESYQLVRQLADALTAAHRRGLAHLRLTPASVLRTDSGQYRIDGIAVNAALRGIEADDKAAAAQQDTRAIGALLFAALTHRWPYPEGGHGLQGLPRDLGTVPAERVRAGVHRGLSDLTARTLCTPPGGKLTPIITPEELAKAVTELPKVRQPEPEPLVLPSYPPHRSASGPSSAAPTSATPTVPPHRQQAAPAPQPALPGRSGRALKWAVSLVVLGAIALGSWGTAEALMAGNNSGSTNTQLSQGTTGGRKTGGGPANDGRTLKTLPLSSSVEFSPLDPDTIAGNQAALAIDGKPGTSWITKGYDGYPNFGNLPNRKDGSGILVDLGSVQSVSEVKVLLPFAGQTQEILAAPADATGAPTDLSGFTQRISNVQLLPGTSLDSGVLAKPVNTRYVLIHVTSLPVDPSDSSKYRGGISEIQVLG